MKTLKHDEIAGRVVLLLGLLKLKKYEVAETLGISNPHFSSVLNGRYPFSENLITAICETYSVNRDWLVDGKGDIFAGPLPDPLKVLNSRSAFMLSDDSKDKFLNNLNNFDDTQWALFLGLLSDLMRGIE